MRIWTFSDLHIDVNRKIAWRKPNVTHDVVVIAGDIMEDMTAGVMWIVRQKLNVKPVIFVGGNHEFYGQDRNENLEAAIKLSKNYENIHILQNSHVDIDGVRFIGATLWTNYEYGGGTRETNMIVADSYMNDHVMIRNGSDATGQIKRWRPSDARLEHLDSYDYLSFWLKEPFGGKRVVVTHHGPSPKSIAPRYVHSAVNGAYVSDLEHLVARADLWIHGHVHAKQDYKIDDCRVICNPRGYIGYSELTNWNSKLVIEV